MKTKEPNEIEKLIDSIKKAYDSGSFKNFIQYIRFPFYKNLEKNSRIVFDFPLTVLVGQNGSGKSSALHAIYGMPEGYSTGIFWFATNVDPIVDDSRNRPGFVYGYKNDSNEIVEVVKTRIGTSKGGHYWEPSRPLLKWGMKKQGTSRNPTIVKDVYYLDFRSELSAYDKFFYFSNFRATKNIKTKQDSVRIKSKHLKNVIDSNVAGSYHKRKIKQPIILDSKELKEVNAILGKNYVECKLIQHNLYSEIDGLTVYFRTSDIAYSEAFAGRGEFAVVKLVYEIMNTPDYSLVILDEPEVSLHPGAQEKLLIFLLKQALNKKLQVVLTTHSPKFVQYLPENALKLFYPSNDARFGIKNECHYLEVFQYIGQEITSSDKKIIYVEDLLAKIVLENVLLEVNNELSLLFEIRFLNGGADDLIKTSARFCQENENQKYIVLDGDKTKRLIDPLALTGAQSSSFAELEKVIKEIIGVDFKKLGFSIDGSEMSGGNQAQKIDLSLKYLSYLFSNLEFFPNNKTPEDIIWNVDFAKGLLTAVHKQIPEFSDDNKDNIYQFTNIYIGNQSEASYITCCQILVNEFIRNKNDDYLNIVSILNKFR